MADNKFTGIQVDVKSEDELIVTVETSDGTALTFSASVDQVEEIMEVLGEAFEEIDEADYGDEDDAEEEKEKS